MTPQEARETVETWMQTAATDLTPRTPERLSEPPGVPSGWTEISRSA